MSQYSKYLLSLTARNAQENGDLYKEEEPQGFTGGVMSGLLGTASGVASFAHADDLANSIEEYRLENYTPTQPVETDLTSLDYWLNPNGAIYDVGNMVGSSIPSLAVGVATGGLGSALGAGSMLARGATAAAQTVGRRALGATAQNAIRRFGNEGLGYLGSSLVDSTSEGGNARMQAIQQGNPNADSVAWEVALKNIPLNALSNAAEWNIARRGWLNRRGVSGEGFKKRAVNLVPRALPALGVNALQEGTQELAQQTISDSALGNPVGNFLDPSSWTDEQRQSFQAGLLGGAVLGGAPALARAARGGGQSQSQGNRMSIDEFMTKVGMQETGGDGYTTTNKDSGAYGKYQIMPENWQPWVEEARAAGVDVGSGDRSDPKSQEAVAKFKMEQYREAYGDEGAFVAWYSGPANAERWANGETTDINGRPWDAPQGEYPSIKSYVESTLNQKAVPGNYADSYEPSDFSLDLKNEIIDFANDKANSSTDTADIDFFADKTTTNIGQDGRYDKKTFVPTEENIKQVIRKYPQDFFDAQLRAKNRRSINNYHNNLIEGALFARRNSRPNQQLALPYIPVDNNRVLQILKEQLQNQGEEKNKLANDIETQRKDEQLKYLTRLLQNISRDTQTRRNNNRTRNAYENITAQRQSALSNLRGSGQATPVQLVQPRNNDYQERARDISGRLRPVDYNPVGATAVNNNGQNIFEDEMNTQGMLNGLLSQYNEQQTNERNARIANALYSGNQGGYSSDDKSNPLNWDNNMLLPFDWNESEQGSPNRRVQNTQPTDNIMQGIFDGLVPEYRRQREQQRNERLARALSEGNQGGYSSDDRSNPINWTNDMLLPLDMYGDWNANREPKYTAKKANKAPEKPANEPAENKAAEPTEKTTKTDEKSEQKNKPATSKEEKTQKEEESVRKDEAKQKANIEKTSEKADNISNNANSNEVNDNGILNEEQDRRGNTANGREQSRRAGENEEEGQPTPADTETDRNEGQPARRPDTDDNAELSSDGRLSGTEQTENGSRNDSVGNDERKIEPVSSETVEKVSTQPALINYRMSDKDDVGEGGKETRYKNNIKAIKLLKQLEVEGRKATPTEQKVLARYSGWGGLTSAFSDEKTNNELKELLTNEEYAAAKSSILSAYYTAPNVVKSIWKIADNLGFKGGRILEPSMGVGNFFGLMPPKIMNNSNLTGVELDSISGQIASQLYQRANINITGFENLQAPDNFFDLAIGNVPFGQFGVHDPKFNKYRFEIHNYFFAKALDKVRPGGIVMFITTKGTMDNAGSSRRLRTYLGGKADLIDAIRLPDTAFKGNTGTSVISDIIILKKRTDPSKADIHAKQWEDIEAKEIDGRNFYLNEYYVNHPEMIAGKLEAVSGRYGGDALNVSGKDIDLTKKLSEITKNISKDVYQPHSNTTNVKVKLGIVHNL